MATNGGHPLVGHNKMPHGHSKATWTDSPALPQMSGDSAMQNTSAGSGSRPTRSKFAIETSAPGDAHTLDRAPKDWLK